MIDRIERLPDGAARRRIREDLAATLFVEAAAGTGKTTELVARIVAIIREGETTLDRIVAVTFTEKAAGEMKLRLREEIEKARGGPDVADVADVADVPEVSGPAKDRLDRALGHLELARIGTIHAYCAELLRERPVEAGIDPLFEVAAEDEADALLTRAFDGWFEQMLGDPPEGARRILRRRSRAQFDQGPRSALRFAVKGLSDHRDFPTRWQRPAFDRERAIDLVMDGLEDVSKLVDRAEWSEDWLAKSLRELARFVEETRLREDVRGRDYDGLEAELRSLARSRHWRWRGSPYRPYGPGLARETVIARRGDAKVELDRLIADGDSDLAACLQRELVPAVEAYEILKHRNGRLDFLDLLLRARDLIRGNAKVRAELQQRFTHFYVDEFQDTDPLQAEILLLLAADDPAQDDWLEVRPVAGKLFVVGDPKQSIYRFRRADVAVYDATKRQLERCGADVVYLTTSFRSVPSIQAAVNGAFEPHMPGGSDHQADYVRLESFRTEPDRQPTVVALPVPAPYGDYGTIVKWRIEESFPIAVGAFIDWLVNESGWTIEGEDGGRVRIAPRHVCLLFRRFKQFRSDVTRPYVRALEARRLPHVLVGGHSFHQREEVLAIRNAVSAIEWPDDELRVFATLRGPLFGVGDDALLAYRSRFLHLRPMRSHDNDELEGAEREVAGALEVLAALHRKRNHRPVADTVSELLEAVRAHAGIAIWPTGDQALANCLRVIDLARRFERRGAPSFRAFVERLEADAEAGNAQDAPLVEEGTEGVRIMTVHRAKGLEFPVVILADPTCRATRETPTRHVDPGRRLWAEPLCGCPPKDLLDAQPQELERDREEAVRLAYVAATRARDLLVVPVVGDEEPEGWVDVLNPAVYPNREDRKAAKPAPKCPDFGSDSVLERPAHERAGTPDDSVAPGLHTPRVGSHGTVWWDPRALDLDRQESVGLHQQRILEADNQADGAADKSIAAHDAWQASRRETLEAGAKPTLVVQSVTNLAHEREPTDGDEREIQFIEVEVDRSNRPGGKRFGTLVHAVLAVIDPHARHDEVLSAARAQGRLIGATDGEVDAAAEAVAAAMKHDIFRRAAHSANEGRLYRETPLLLRLEDGTLAEGVIDLAFKEDTRGQISWTVVDFKTDRELAHRRPQYEAQVRLYVRALETATGEPARGSLLVV